VKYVTSFLFYITVAIFTTAGFFLALADHSEKVLYADLRVSEVRHGIAEVTRLGLVAEEQYRKTGSVPSDMELNCWEWQQFRRPCASIYFILKTVRVDESGVVHAHLSSPGVPFTPTRSFTVDWDSKSRSTNQDWRVESWQWHLLFVRALLFDALVIAFPWLVRWGWRALGTRNTRRRSAASPPAGSEGQA
jgi:hypothetical protein